MQIAALAVSYSDERAATLVFPTAGTGQPETQLRMFRLGYVFLRSKGSLARWNGRRFVHLSRPIGVQRGHSVAEFLRQQQVDVDDGTAEADALLAKLRLGRLDGVAVSQPHWRDLMEQSQWAETLEVAGPALMKRDYFLAFSPDFFKRAPNRARRIWQDLARLRESTEFRVAFARHLGLSTSDINASP